MTDLLQRLRDYPHEICDEAADEIERLRAELDALVLEASVLAEYGRDDGRRELWIDGTWLYPGDRVVLLHAPTASQTTGTEPGAEGA